MLEFCLNSSELLQEQGLRGNRNISLQTALPFKNTHVLLFLMKLVTWIFVNRNI